MKLVLLGKASFYKNPRASKKELAFARFVL